MAWEGSKFLGGVESIRQKINCFFEDREKETREVDETYLYAEIGKPPSLEARPDFYVLLAYRPPEDNFQRFANMIRELQINEDGAMPYVRVLLCSKLSYTEKSKTPIVFMSNHGKDFSLGDRQYSPRDRVSIPPGSRVLTVGDALYAVTRIDDLDVDRFFDSVFNQTYFWSPDYRSWIYPVSHLFEIVADRFESLHLGAQLRTITAGLPVSSPRRIPAVIEENATLEMLRVAASTATAVAIDTETDGLDFIENRVWCITLSFDGRTAYFVDTRKWLKGGQEWKDFTAIVKPLKQVWANGKFDIKFFRKMGVPYDDLRVDWDVDQAGHVLNELAQRNGLKAQAWVYTTEGGYQRRFDYAFHTLAGKKIANIPWPILQEYAAMDAIVTYRVFRSQDQQFTQIDHDFPNNELEPNGWSLRRYYEEVMLPTVSMFIDIEEQGMMINRSMIDEARVGLNKLKDRLEKEVKAELNSNLWEDFSLDSGPQLGARLQQLGWECIAKAKAGYYLTNDFCLQKWAKTHKAADLIMQYRSASTLLKTYVGQPAVALEGEVQYDLETEEEILPEMSNPTGFYKHLRWHEEDRTWRVHPTFWAMLADTGRNRCDKPNLQNIPKHGESAKLIRKFFDVPGPDWMIGEWDASGLQLRIAGILSEDQTMYEAFMDAEIDGDLHSVTGQTFFAPDVPLKEFRERVAKKEPEFKHYRRKSKNVNFSLIFGTSAFALAMNTLMEEWTVEECRTYVEANKLQKSRAFFLSLLYQEDGMGRDFPSDASKEEFSNYWCVAADLKDKWFKKYPMVADWIERYMDFAKKHGYIRSVFGAIRRTPQLMYEGKATPRSEFKNILNMTSNSPVQNYEAVVMMTAMVEIHKRLKQEGLRSYIVGNVHDSCVVYIYKPEAQRVFDIAQEAFERPRPENKGIPLTLEMDVADVRAGIYWGHRDAAMLH